MSKKQKSFVLFVFLVSSAVSTGRLSVDENRERIQKCGTKKLDEIFLRGQVRHNKAGRYAIPVPISQRHLLLTCHAVFNASWTYKDVTYDVSKDCQDGVMNISDKINLMDMDFNQFSSHMTYIGHCDPNKPPEGLVVAEMNTTVAYNTFCLPGQDSSKLTVHEEGEIVACPVTNKGKFCTTAVLAVHGPFIEERDKRLTLIGFSSRLSDNVSFFNTEAYSILPYKENICKLFGICPDVQITTSTASTMTPSTASTVTPTSTTLPTTTPTTLSTAAPTTLTTTEPTTVAPSTAMLTTVKTLPKIVLTSSKPQLVTSTTLKQTTVNAQVVASTQALKAIKCPVDFFCFIDDIFSSVPGYSMLMIIVVVIAVQW